MTSRAQKTILAWLRLQEKAALDEEVIFWVRSKIVYVTNQNIDPDPISKRERQLMDKITELETKLRGIESAKKASDSGKGSYEDIFKGFFK